MELQIPWNEASERVGMSTRKQQILQAAVELIATRGYSAFTMRSLAKQCGLTLGALQYHYASREVLIRAITAHIHEQYSQSFELYMEGVGEEASFLDALVGQVLVDPADERLMADKLFPQLWAMAAMEPIVEKLLAGLYEGYLSALEEGLRQQGVANPRPDALVLMAMLEGLTLFSGRGQRWESDAEEALAVVRDFVQSRCGS